MRASNRLGGVPATIASVAAITVPAVVATILKFAGEEITLYGVAMSLSATIALSALFFALFLMPLIFALYRFSLLNCATLLLAGAAGGGLTACALSFPHIPSGQLLSIELAMGALAGASFWLFSKVRIGTRPSPIPVARADAS